MAKTSVIEREHKRRLAVARHYSKRKALKKIIVDMRQPVEVRQKAQLKLAKMPRDTSPTRLRNRCAITGRPRGNYRKFGLSRHMIRLYANLGQIPGLLKSSW
jgi:small subunit ribosomal protein S14